MIGFLINLLFLALIFVVVFWIIGLFGLPDNIRKILLAIMGLIFLLLLLGMLMGGVPQFPYDGHWRLR